MTSIRIALLNTPVITGAKAENLRNLKDYFIRCASEGASFAFAPELALTGYAVRDFESLSETIDGSSVQELSELATKLNITVGYGIVLRKGNDIFNGYIISSNGENHEFGKFHRWWYGDRDFKPWAGTKIITISGIKIGVMVCFDGRFPEISRVLALAGADVIVWPCNWPLPPKSNPEYLQIIGKARAFENQCYVALTNRVGESEREKTSYAGCSALFGPMGETLKSASGKEDILFCSIEPKSIEHIRSNFDIYTERKPDLYRPVSTIQAPPWHNQG